MPPEAQQILDALVAAPPLEGYLVVGALLFAIGAWGALVRRNAVVVRAFSNGASISMNVRVFLPIMGSSIVDA